MGNKNKPKINSTNPSKQDSFDVKANLKKLHNNNRQSGQSDYNYLQTEATTNDVVSSNNFTNGFQETTYKEFKELNNKIHSNFSSLKEDIHQVKSNFDSKISAAILEVKKDFDSKIDSKIDSKYFSGAIACLVIIVGIIGTLSYFPMISDIKELRDKNIIVTDSVKNMHERINKIVKKP